MSSSLNTALAASAPPTRKRTQAEITRLQESRRAASERYRERHREKVLEEGRARAARQRAILKLPGKEYIKERARERAREASARYRERNRAELALKQRKVRKAAYIKKHGIHAYVQRRYGDSASSSSTAAPSAEVEDAEEENDASAPWTWNADSAPFISDYYDPFLRR